METRRDMITKKEAFDRGHAIIKVTFLLAASLVNFAFFFSRQKKKIMFKKNVKGMQQNIKREF